MSHPIVIVGCAERLMQVDDEAQKNLSAGASFKRRISQPCWDVLFLRWLCRATGSPVVHVSPEPRPLPAREKSGR
jgi:hypothetical protein